MLVIYTYALLVSVYIFMNGLEEKTGAIQSSLSDDD